MITALWLFAAQGALGAFDTLYYHEWRARLPGGLPGTRPELVLHGLRDLVYAVLFGTLALVRWEGLAAYALAALVAVEIVITLRDFVIEDTVRRPLGGVFPGERMTHAIMGIIYGAALAHLAPEIIAGTARPTGFVPWEAPAALRVILPLMAAGVFASGVRDLGAAFGPRWFRYPWAKA
ncbi:Cell division inhibitor [Minicystis rosea]|nr:Cell division inhibitor [Minicystis rosea]